MIEVGGYAVALDDPGTLLAIAAGALVLILLLLSVRGAGRAAAAAAPLGAELDRTRREVASLAEGQGRLAGGLQAAAEAQASGQMRIVQSMEERLADVQRQTAEALHASAVRSQRSLGEMQERMHEVLNGSAQRTSVSLTQLQERLAAIDKAQTNIEALSGNVLGLQDILANKQRRGMFGEIQLNDIVGGALPPDAYVFQHTLSNGKRADCLVKLPNPPGPIVIDAKFPLEAFETLARAEDDAARARALKELGAAVRVHIRAIAERYVIEGETADGALMFLPSEAVYAELHARLPEVVREGFAARVWIVSPTTCMATLHTMRAVMKDARMREQTGAIRRELGALHKDVERLGTRVGQPRPAFRAGAEGRRGDQDQRPQGRRTGRAARRVRLRGARGRAAGGPRGAPAASGGVAPPRSDAQEGLRDARAERAEAQRRVGRREADAVLAGLRDGGVVRPLVRDLDVAAGVATALVGEGAPEHQRHLGAAMAVIGHRAPGRDAQEPGGRALGGRQHRLRHAAPDLAPAHGVGPAPDTDRERLGEGAARRRGARGDGVRGRLDPAHRGGERVLLHGFGFRLQHLATDRVPASGRGSALVAEREMRRHDERVRLGQGAGGIGQEDVVGQVMSHRSLAQFMAWRRRSSASRILDLMVPSGSPVSAAISLWERSPK